MKRDHYISAVIIGVILLIGVMASFPIAQTEVTWEGILPGISTELGGSYAINVAYTASTVGWDVSEESALTNTVQEIMSLTHTTSGTPANGIGLEWVATQETSAANNEDIGAVQFYMSDVTSTSEDASFGIELMAAGAAKTEVLTVTSVGALAIDSGLTVNGDGDDADTLIKTDDDANAFVINAGDDTINFGTWSNYDLTTVNQMSYSIQASDRAGGIYINTYTDTGAAWMHLMSDLVEAGRVVKIKDADLNANTNNIVITTEGAETIDEAATHTMDADGESITLICDGTNWFVMESYGE